MKTLRTLLAICLLALPLGLNAQSRAEKSLYGKTMKNFTVKSADKFLKKYPRSVYAAQVTHMKDSILLAEYLEANMSKLTPEVLVLDEGLSLRLFMPDGKLVEQRSLPVYTLEERAPELTLVQPAEVITPLGEEHPYVHYAYRNGATEYVEVLYEVEGDIAHQALFYGSPMEGGRIEGQSPEMMEGHVASAEIAWLAGQLRENESLVPITKADILTDDSIRWWLQKNPKADTSAQKLVFGRLDPESSIAQACKGASKEKGKNVSVASFDIRGYTVICAVSSKGDYTLVWCEPVCKNRKTDRYIRSLFFENDGTTLDVVYYKGKTTFKNKISLTGQTIRHLK